MSKTSGSAAIREQATGPVFTKNDPAKFKGAGKASGKTPANGIEVGPTGGMTWTENSTHIPTMNADKPAPMSKVKKTGKWFDPHSEASAKDASTVGSGGGLSSYPLKSSYEK